MSESCSESSPTRAISTGPSGSRSLIYELLSYAGVFEKVTFIQRIKTAGGKPPSAPGSADGQEERIHYAATYIFYGPGAKPASP